MVRVLNFSEIDCRFLEFSEPYNGRYGGQSLTIKYMGEKIAIQTPKCGLPYGINSFDTGTSTKYSADLVLDKDTDKIKDFLRFLKEFDEAIKSKAHEMSVKWFGRELETEVIDSIHKNSLRKNGTVMRTKIVTDTKSNPLCTIFDEKKNIMSISNIVKSDCQCVLELTGIYFIAKEFGCTWKVMQMMVFPIKTLSGYAFIDSDDEDEDAEPVE